MADPSIMFQQPNAGERFAQAFKEGQETRKQNIAKAAYAALVRDPNNDKALEALAGVRPELAQQFQQQRAEQAKAQLGEYHSTIKTAAEMGRRIKAENPQMPDDQVYGTVRQSLINMRMPGAEQAPPQFDPSYWNGVLSLADPVAQKQGQLVPYTQGGGVARLNPQTGHLETLVMPNPGDHPTGSPVNSLPQVSDQASYDAIPPGQQYTTPDGHTRVKQGGQSGAAPAGNF